MAKKSMRVIGEYTMITAATFVVAAAVYFFLIPSGVSVGSISGLAMLLGNVIPLPISVLTFILNAALLVVGFLFIGREFGVKTVYTSLILPVFLWVFEQVFPDFVSINQDAMMDTVCYIFVVSVGLALLFRMNASSGGLDIVAKLLNKYFHMELGKAMALPGMCVALSSVFFSDKKLVVLGILGTYLNGIVLDHFIFDHDMKRRVCIITEKEEELRKFIIEDLHSGATIYESIGAYNMQKRNEIIAIVDKAEYQKLMNYISREDPHAFITVYTVSDIRYQPKRQQ